MATASNPAVPGFSSLLGPAAFSFLPALLGSLGLFGNPQQDLMRRIRQLQGGQGKLTDQLYQQNIGSPAYSQALGTIAAGGNATGGQIASELGARGIGTSGTGAILSGLVPSIVGQQQGQLRTGAFQSAQQQAMQQIQQQIQALMGSQGPGMGGQLFGAGLNAFAPFLQQYMGARYPGTFGTTQQQGTR